MLLFYLSLIESAEDKLKFGKLYLEYGPFMKYMAKKILNDKNSIEDVVHEAFIKLTRHLDGIDEIVGHKTKSFIVIVIRSVCFDANEKGKRRRFISLEDCEEEFYVDEDILQTIEMKELYSLINLLPPIHKDVIDLKVNYEKTDKEIADILNISNHAARKRLQRARDAFEKILSEKGEY